MKIQVTLKDPDGFSEAVEQAVKDSLSEANGIDDDEKDTLREGREEGVWVGLGKWVQHQEYVTIEFDTDQSTATVLMNVR